MSEKFENIEAAFDRALEVAEKHLEAATKEGGLISPYVSVAMIQAAVNQAVSETSASDIADMLRDLADQIDADEDEEGDNDNDVDLDDEDE